MNLKPSYYAVIPAEVRYDSRLSGSEKLMYGEITALSSSTGECWASNAYFAELYGKDVRSVKRWVKSLTNLGYINSKLEYRQGSKEVKRRILTLVTKVTLPSDKVVTHPSDKNVTDNNTSKNTTSIIDGELFESIWKAYGCKGNKGTAKEYWNRLSKANREEIAEAAPRYIELREREYRKDFQGWINPKYKRWRDQIEDKTVKPLTFGG